MHLVLPYVDLTERSSRETGFICLMMVAIYHLEGRIYLFICLVDLSELTTVDARLFANVIPR